MMLVDANNPNPKYALVDSGNSITLTIYSNKRWIRFFLTLFVWLTNSFCFLPILALVIGAALQQYLPPSLQWLVWLLVLGLGILTVIWKFDEVVDFASDKEKVEISDEYVRIEKTGLGLRSQKKISANIITGISLMYPVNARSGSILRQPWLMRELDALLVWRGQGWNKFTSFGRGLTPAEAQGVLDVVFRRFPHYQRAS